MVSRSSLSGALLVLLCGCSRLSPEMEVVHEAAEAMGGVEAVLAARTLVMEGTGQTYRLGQSTTPESDLPVYEVESYRREMDLENGRWRADQVRTGNFLTGTPVLQQMMVQVLDGEVAYDIQPGLGGRRLTGRVARDRRMELYHHPLPLLRAALADSAAVTVANLREQDGHDVIDVTPAGGPTLQLHVDRATGLPARIESLTSDPVLGDVTLATTFSDWAPAGELTLPRTLSQKLDRFPNGDFTVVNVVNAPIAELAAPPDVASAAEPVPGPIEVGVEELADGVWYLRAGYNSVLVEFPTYAVLVEAAQTEARTLAVVAKARELVPDKPLRYVLNTHFHFDHSGGVRAAVAEGLTVLTHEIHRSFFEDAVARPHTLAPDHLSENPRPLSIETVTGDGPFELRDGDRTMIVYRLQEDVHSDGMLMAYLPRERILIEADAFTPGARAAPFAANLLAQVRALGLEVDRIAPIHGRVVPFEELERTVAMLMTPMP